LLLGLSLIGCRDLGSGWSVDTLFPMVDSRLDLVDIMTDSLVHTNSDNQLMLVYEGKIIDFSMDDFKIPDTTVLQNHPGPGVTLNWPKRVPLISDTSDNSFDVPNVDLVRTTIKSGKMEVKITSSIREDIEITYIMPGATKGGVPLSITRVLPGSPSLSNPTIRTETIDLSGYTVDLRGKNRRGYNTMIYYFTAEFVDKLNPDSIYQYGSTDYMNIENSFVKVIPEDGHGVFHTQTLSEDSISDETSGLFKNVLSGSIDLEQVKLDLSFKNYIGADFQGVIHKLASINSETGNRVDLKSDYIGKSININRALLLNNGSYPPIRASYYTIGLDEKNSNIDKLIENFPDQFAYHVDFVVNPDGNVSGGNDFIYTDYGIEGLLNIEMPLSLIANNLKLFDTTDFDPGEGDEGLKDVIGGYLHVYCDNWYPFDAEIQLKLLDKDNGELIDLFLPESNIKAGIVDENGVVTAPTRTKISAPANQQRMDQFYRAEKAIVYLTFNTEGEEHKKVYASYYCNLKVIADLQYNLEIK